MKGLVIVQCVHCENQFPAGIQADEQSFVSSTIKGNVDICPKCRQKTTSGKSNSAYRLSDGTLKHVGPSFDPSKSRLSRQ